MKKEIYDKSIQNSRIDLNIKTGDVKFGLPAKKKSKNYEVIYIGTLLLIPYMLVLGVSISLSYLYFNNWMIPMEQIGYSFQLDLIEQGIITLRFLSIFSGPFIIAVYPVYVNRNLLKKIPKIQFFLAKYWTYRKCYVARFENIKNKNVSIPLFRNIILKYEADGDYAKYLKNIKIVEHPFMDVMRSEKGIRVRPNEYLWKCDVFFEKVPKNGKIDLFFM